MASGINNVGQIVGGFGDASFNSHGFVFDGTTFTPLDVPGATSTVAFGINNVGQIVGQFANIGFFNVHGFLATPVP